jgi:DNA-binding MarR family transcriptional regulator
LKLSDAQVRDVVEAASNGDGLRSALYGALHPGFIETQRWSDLTDPALSRSLIAGLLILSTFPDDGTHIGNAEVAALRGMSVSTSHRYISTLVAMGLLERDSETRKYRRTR